jgi:hypothetical protein
MSLNNLWPPKEKQKLTILIDLPEIGGFHCSIDLSRIPVYPEASLLYRLHGLLPLGRNASPTCSSPRRTYAPSTLSYDADALCYSCEEFE